MFSMKACNLCNRDLLKTDFEISRVDLLQVDLLASGEGFFRPRRGRPSDEVARGRPSSRAILNPTKDFF